MKKIILFVIVTITLIHITSCITNVPGYYLNVQTTLDETEKFNYTELNDIDTNKNIAILPVSINSKNIITAGERKFLNELLNTNLNLQYSGYTINPADTTINIINENALTENYSSLINDYRNTGIISKPKMEKISNALKSRYILYTDYIILDDETEVEVKHYDDNDETDKTTTKITNNVNYNVRNVIMSYQLWDSKYAKPVFETTVSTGTVQANIINGTVLFEELVAKNVTAFATEMKNKNGQSVCPECPKSRTEYNKKIYQTAKSNLVWLCGIGAIIVLFVIVGLARGANAEAE